MGVVSEVLLSLPEGGERKASLALPPGARETDPVPGVVVIHDITGHRADTARHCRRFADAGYAALAPDLYDGWSPACIVRCLLSAAREEGPAYTVVEAARQHLAALPEVDGARMGITGFCMGGGFALLAAADGAYAVAAPFYGTVPTDRERLRGLCPTLWQGGEGDVVFRPHARRLSAHLEALGVPHEVILHEGVGHSFMNAHPDPVFLLGRLTPMRAAYSAEVEALAWERLLAFFAAHGLASSPPRGG